MAGIMIRDVTTVGGGWCFVVPDRLLSGKVTLARATTIF
jgi:hypothetical protein